MTTITRFDGQDWHTPFSSDAQAQALAELESGHVLFFPTLSFDLSEAEKRFLSPNTVGNSKNVSFDFASGVLRGASKKVNLSQVDTEALHTMMARFATYSGDLLGALLPHYTPRLMQARTSFRPVEVAGRQTSWRKDDTRLHVDSFPSSPVQDKRILRIFSNVNPGGRPRAWRLGESFEEVAARFLPGVSAPLPGSGALLQLLRITKSRRTAYDHFMLQLHDRMKDDADYQANARQVDAAFPPGSTWIVFTDQVSHAAMAGQHLFEQTFYLPVAAMRDPARSPLRTLERLTHRPLVAA